MDAAAVAGADEDFAAEILAKQQTASLGRLLDAYNCRGSPEAQSLERDCAILSQQLHVSQAELLVDSLLSGLRPRAAPSHHQDVPDSSQRDAVYATLCSVVRRTLETACPQGLARLCCKALRAAQMIRGPDNVHRRAIEDIALSSSFFRAEFWEEALCEEIESLEQHDGPSANGLAAGACASAARSLAAMHFGPEGAAAVLDRLRLRAERSLGPECCTDTSFLAALESFHAASSVERIRRWILDGKGRRSDAAAVHRSKDSAAPAYAVDGEVVLQLGEKGAMQLRVGDGLPVIAMDAAERLLTAAQPSGRITFACGSGMSCTAVPGSVRCLRLMGSRGAAVAGLREGGVHVIDAETAREMYHIGAHPDGVTQLQPMASWEHMFLSGGREGTTHLWDVRQPGAPAASLRAGQLPVTAMAVHDETMRVLIATEDLELGLWDLRKGSGGPSWRISAHAAPVTSATFLGGARALTASRDWTARVWTAESGACEGVLAGHGGAVTAASAAFGSTWTVLTAAADGSARVWGRREDDGGGWALVQALPHEQSPVACAAIGSRSLVVVSSENAVTQWDLRSSGDPSRPWRPTRAWHGCPAQVRCSAYSGGGGLFTGTQSGSIYRWHLPLGWGDPPPSP
uniref:Stomatal cytokinesis-defective 1 family protein n=1 Tax=Tetraselmis sp. GSL018 TaxID=582737 RepID=A0A061QZF4_9CHLO